MEQVIKINVPEGKRAVYNENTQTIEFIDITRSKSWEEFCENHPNTKGEYWLDQYSNIYTIISSGPRCAEYRRSLLATKEDAEAIRALMQLTRLHDEWVEGSDYKKYSEKAYIYIEDIPHVSVGFNHHFLDFPTSKMAREFLDCFKELITKAQKYL